MGNEYYKSYYLKLSPSTPSVKLTLLSIEEFESLTYEHGPHKTHFRLNLLVSPSYLPPGGRKTFCFHQIPLDNLDVINNNGHFGCGFIHPAYSVQLIGSSQPAQSVFAIQVQIIGSLSAGVTKSVLFTNKTMEVYKILLPEAIAKVNKSMKTLLHAPVVLGIGQCVQANNQPSSQKFLREVNKPYSLLSVQESIGTQNASTILSKLSFMTERHMIAIISKVNNYNSSKSVCCKRS